MQKITTAQQTFQSRNIPPQTCCIFIFDALHVQFSTGRIACLPLLRTVPHPFLCTCTHINRIQSLIANTGLSKYIHNETSRTQTQMEQAFQDGLHFVCAKHFEISHPVEFIKYMVLRSQIRSNTKSSTTSYSRQQLFNKAENAKSREMYTSAQHSILSLMTLQLWKVKGDWHAC